MEQEHRITYKAGITRTPSDFLCADGELAECINLATDNEELKPMVQPAEVVSGVVGRILYVHKFNNIDRYIHLVEAQEQSGQSIITVYDLKVSTDGVNVSWLTNIASTSRFYTPNITVTSIGKTLVVNEKSKPLTYYLWNDENGGAAYVNLGKLPEPQFDFWLVNGIEAERQADRMGRSTGAWQVFNTGKADGIIKHNGVSNVFQVKDKENYNNLVIGLYAKNKKSIKAGKHFCCPFFIRTALELYDGSYTHISQPILMLPSETENTYSLCQYWSVDDSCDFTVYTTYSELHFKQTKSLTLWNDVIKNVVVFMSDDIDIYNTLKDQPYEGLTTHGYTITVDGLFRKSNSSSISEYVTVGWSQYFTDGSYIEKSVMALAKKEQSSILNDIKSASLYYKVCDIGLEPINTDTNIGKYIDERTLTNLVTQEMLSEDDYFSRSTLCPGYVYSYNSRLNLANVLRSVFEGYGFFMPFDNASPSTYDFYVEINTGTETVWVHHQETTSQKQGIYFYYPDARADKVVIKKNGTTILNEALTEHPRINGAYFLKGLPGVTEDEPTSAIDIPISVNNDYLEALPNYIIQSDVNNPWVFKAQGYFKVGTGKIIGMSTITQALSQGQFGQYPLLVFSESGIWALSVANTGYYSAIYPMSRDVCINPSSIIQTDGAVFFVSKKGLMVVAGNEVACVSERMNGVTFNTSTLTPLATDTEWSGIVTACQTNRSFLDYIRDEDCFMAYDYIDSRILIINPDFGFAFAYNISDGTISKTILPAAMTNAVNNYPDYLLQGTVTQVVEGQTVTVSKLYSFYEKPREEEVSARSLALLLTRPMKLAGPVSQASLRQLMNVGTWNMGTAQNPLSCVKTEIYLSDNMQDWYYDKSRHGAAARYYRLALFVKMIPTERLSGTILTSQERRSDHMR